MTNPEELIDASRPQAARRYDALLGGKDNFSSDRASAAQIRQELPSVDRAAQELRRFLERVVHYLAADCGIRQFIDIGCGLPHRPNVHEIAQAIDPTAHVIYVDPDPLVGAHARALLNSHPQGATYFKLGGLDDVHAILTDDTVQELIDFRKPAAVLLLAVLHFVPDDQHAHDGIDRLTAAVSPGSYVAVSHVTFDPLPTDHAERLAKLAEPGAGHGPFRARTHSELCALLNGLEVLEPGVVSVVDWHREREPHPQITGEQAVAYGVLARKSRPATAASAGAPPVGAGRVAAGVFENVVHGMSAIEGVPVTEPTTDSDDGTAADRDGGRRADKVGELRSALVDQLRADQKITSPAVEAAFRTVPRERFVPAGTPLEVAYGVDNSVVTKRDEHGVALSSVSAAYIQARMLEQAELRPGMSVLEVGSGGLNAALIAEIVGPAGRVVSVDIDPEVTDRAARLLDETGYGKQVRVIAADAAGRLPGEGPFDAIIVTVGAWDIAPAWIEQLTEDGVLVLPLIMNGVTRTIGFRRDGERLTSTSIEVAGFVPMQGIGQHPERVFLLPDPNGKQVKLRFDAGTPLDMTVLDGVLATDRTHVWSGVTISHGVSFADLHLWFAWYLPGFCLLAVDEGTQLAAESGTWFPFGVVQGSAFAYLAVRPALGGGGVEFGAGAYGRDGELAATAMVEQIQAWNRHGQHRDPAFTYWPSGADRTGLRADVAVMDKTHGVLTITWPAHD
ncbi:methyltransferase, FxLD system [Nucisporomicrobium flavum]|uniref:methyltransferase, FxLD system n=1 Tax=Nucisporomicrobium flavum TaxID=2785915 RepID=UPI003C2EF8E7